MTQLTALVIDDELFAREELIELLEETEQIDIIGEASNAIEGLKKINQLKPDVVFLASCSASVKGLGLHLSACSLYSTLNAIGPVLTLWK